MKIVRFGEKGKERLGVIISEGHCLDLSSVDEGIPNDLPELLENIGIDRISELISKKAGEVVHLEGFRVGAIVKRPSNIVCLGLNYRDHAEETGQKLPKVPRLFSKSPSAITGPYDDIILPPQSKLVDYEAELAVIMGKRAYKVKAEQAMNYIAGFTILNDVSARDIQILDGQFFRSKSFTSFCPIGPYLVSKDEIPEPHNLKITLKIYQGDQCEIRQNSNTKNLIFKIPEIIEFITHTFELFPGDVISTGTAAGVALGYVPNLREAIKNDKLEEFLQDDKNQFGISRFLKPGQVVEIEIEGLGKQRSRVIDSENKA